jgi:hypothetical protein
MRWYSAHQAWALGTASRQADCGESTWARKVQKVTKGLKSRWRLALPFGCGPSSESGIIAPNASRSAEIESAFGS